MYTRAPPPALTDGVLPVVTKLDLTGSQTASPFGSLGVDIYTGERTTGASREQPFICRVFISDDEHALGL